MAIVLKGTTPRDKMLKLVSIKDSAIDWKASFPGDADMTVDEKKNRYTSDRDLQKLAFLDGDKPTLFVFKHPDRVDISRDVRAVITRAAAKNIDAATELFEIAYMGTEEGADDAPLQSPEKRDGRITDRYYQMLEDGGVFDELAMAFIKISNRDRTGDEQKK